jgi:5-methyltetrahydrofolate--homocysteine methyltransferase
MMIEGGGWEVINLGVDIKDEELIEEINKHPGCIVALSALLTTTMVNMENTVRKIKINNPNTRIMIGGAPVTKEFCDEIGADFYSPDPQGVVEYLKTII